jgi:tetratricopeptide (TPR) repeat protein
VGFGTVAEAQVPDTFTNLQVLPKDVSKSDLMTTMKGFTRALGERCVFCHVGDDSQGLRSFDFASDDKKHKTTARAMMLMVNNINTVQLAALKSRENIDVECITCHRGQKEPRLIQDVLADKQKAEGLDATIEYYKALRDEHYGSHTYDFSENMLLGLAESMLREDHAEAAVKWTEVNIEYYPESAFSYFQLGMIHAQSGNSEEAIANLEWALQINPDIPPATRMLQKLKGK